MARAQPAVTCTVEARVGVVRMSARHGNAINEDLLTALAATLGEAEENPEVDAVVLASGGKLFSPGLDLQELLELDRSAMEEFMDHFGSTMLSLYTYPKPVVAALSGHAVAGGCVMSLNADWRILRQGARIGLNEVKVGVPLPYGVAILLREMVHRPYLTEIALLGNNFTDQRAVEVGLVHEIHGAEGFEEHCLARAREFAERDLAAFAITKKYLRSTALERMRVGDSPYRREFLDCWFARETRGRIEAIVEGLRKG